MSHKLFSVLLTGVVVAGWVACSANLSASAEETMKQRWNNGVHHTEARTEQILSNTANSTKRVGNDIKNDTEHVGHRLSHETHKVVHRHKSNPE